MQKTKANFKALRETVGMSQQYLADILGVNVRSIKRWENPKATDYGVAPQDAWDVLEDARKAQKTIVEMGVKQVKQLEKRMSEESDADLNEVGLTYWFSENEYEKAHPGQGREWQMANANSRMVAFELEKLGYSVNFDFPGIKSITE